MRIDRGTLTCGSKDRVSLSPFFWASKAFLTDSVVAMWIASGPAAATRPLREAMLIREAVGDGKDDHLEAS